MLAVAVVFGPNVANRLTNWDDNVNIADNPFLDPLTWAGLGRLWTHAYAQLYVPLTYTSWAFDRLVGGGAQWPHYLGNVVLHAATAVALFHLILRLLPDSAGARARTFCAVAAALLFALHPVQVEAVGWATGRKDTLSGLLAVAALLLYVRAAQACGGGPAMARLRHPAWWGAMAAFVAAILAKPSAVAVPAAALALDWIALGTGLRTALATSAPMLAVSAAFTVVTAGVQPLPEFMGRYLTPAWTRPFVAGDALAFYARKVVAPFGLSPNYGRTPVAAMAQPLNYAWLPLVAAVVAWALWRGRGAVRAGLATALLLISPVLGLIPFVYQSKSTVGDRYLYMPMTGVALAAGALLLAAVVRLPARRRLLAGATVVLLCALGAASAVQARVWRTSVTLWTHAQRVTPDVVANYTNMAGVLLKARRAEEAIAHTTRAVSLDAGNYAAQSNHALALQQLGRRTEALEAMRRAVSLAPSDPVVHALHGDMLNRLERDAEAVAAFEEALLLDPELGTAHLGIATAYANLGRLEDAVTHYREVLRQKPDLARVHSNMGHVLLRLGRRDEAAEHLATAVRLNPGDKLALEELEALRTGALPAPAQPPE